MTLKKSERFAYRANKLPGTGFTVGKITYFKGWKIKGRGTYRPYVAAWKPGALGPATIFKSPAEARAYIMQQEALV